MQHAASYRAWNAQHTCNRSCGYGLWPIKVHAAWHTAYMQHTGVIVGETVGAAVPLNLGVGDGTRVGLPVGISVGDCVRLFGACISALASTED